MEDIGGNAVERNLEVEQMQNDILLLNIARSSLRRPPVYTSLQTISGAVRPKGTVSLSVPFGPGAPANSLGLGITGHDGPSVSTNQLDTQEFYQGIMTPIKPAIVDFYVQQGYSKGLLYNLFFNRIEIRHKDKTGKVATIVFPNQPGDPTKLDAFQMLVDRLIRLGLTTERIPDDGTSYGPLRTAAEVSDLVGTGAVAAAGLEVDEMTWCSFTAADIKRLATTGRTRVRAASIEAGLEKMSIWCESVAGPQEADVDSVFAGLPRVLYRVEKPAAAMKARFCFDGGLYNDGPRSCARSAKVAGALKLEFSLLDSVIGRAADDPRDKSDKDLKAFRQAVEKAAADKPSVEVAIVPRSTDGVIYYLGEVIRRQHYPDSDRSGAEVKPAVVGYRYHLLDKAADAAGSEQSLPVETLCKFDFEQRVWLVDKCASVFWVDTREASFDAVARVAYDGTTYSVPSVRPNETNPAGRSVQVLGIVAQLLALNKSAKDAPATNILTVVNP